MRKWVMRIMDRLFNAERRGLEPHWEPDRHGREVARRLARVERELSTLGVYVDAMTGQTSNATDPPPGARGPG